MLLLTLRSNFKSKISFHRIKNKNRNKNKNKNKIKIKIKTKIKIRKIKEMRSIWMFSYHIKSGNGESDRKYKN